MSKQITTSEVRALLTVIDARLNGEPEDWHDWQAIVIQLRRALRLAEQIRDAHEEPDGDEEEKQ